MLNFIHFKFKSTIPRDQLFASLNISSYDPSMRPQHEMDFEDVCAEYAILYAAATGTIS